MCHHHSDQTRCPNYVTPSATTVADGIIMASIKIKISCLWQADARYYFIGEKRMIVNTELRYFSLSIWCDDSGNQI